MVPYIRRDVVVKYKWITDDDFSAGMGLAQMVPGATAMQVAAWSGLRAGGIPGSLAAYAGFGIPAFLLMLLLSFFYFTYGDSSLAATVFEGLKAVITAFVANATISFAKLYLTRAIHWILTLAAVIMLIMGSGPILALIAVCTVSVFLLEKTQPQAKSVELQNKSFKMTAARLLAVPITAILLLFIFDRDLFQLAFSMIKIDMFAFGGGYVSLPLMLHEVVEHHGWMTRSTFMDGIALGQITPGPIVMTSAFVGYAIAKISGAAVATLAVFTPSFIIINLAAPFYERLRNSSLMLKILRGSLISLVGLMAYITGTFFNSMPFNIMTVLILVISFIAIYKGVDILKVVLLSTAFSFIAGLF